MLTELFSALRDADSWYSIRRAVLPMDKDEAYRVRYRVYCEEKRFEPANPHGMERDAHDAASISLLLSARSGAVCGTVRLVFPDKERQHGLPIDAFFQQPQRAEKMRCLRERHSCAELSRLCVLPHCRGVWGKHDLLLGAFAEAWKMDVDAILAVADPRFERYLKHQKIKFVQIGEPVEKNGTRLPILIDTEANFDRWLELMEEAGKRTDFSNIIPPSTQSMGHSFVQNKKLALA